MLIQWRLQPGEYITSGGASSSEEEIFVYLGPFMLADATLDPQTVADRWGAELVESE